MPSALTELAEIVHVTSPDDPSRLVAVRFRFDEGYLQVEVDPDHDAFPIELSTPSSTTTLQYLAMGSRLDLRHVHDVPTP